MSAFIATHPDYGRVLVLSFLPASAARPDAYAVILVSGGRVRTCDVADLTVSSASYYWPFVSELLAPREAER